MAYNNVINNKLGNFFLQIDKGLIAANITGMSVTPIDLGLPAPGANRFYGVDFWIALRGTGTAYALGGNLQLLYTTSGTVLSSIITSTVMTSANPQIGCASISNTGIPLADMLNNTISIKNNVAAFTTGNAPGRIILKYTLFEVS